eukprot:2893604-Rhodomonas_salina.1
MKCSGVLGADSASVCFGLAMHVALTQPILFWLRDVGAETVGLGAEIGDGGASTGRQTSAPARI